MNTIKQAEVARLLWTGREAAEALCISERTLWSLTKEGKIPCVRIGRAVRYDPADVRSWIESQKSIAQRPETMPELP